MWLEQADDLAGVVRVAAEHVGACLRQHLSHEFDRRGQLGRVALTGPPGHGPVGLAPHRARDPQKVLIEGPHLRLTPLADRQGHAVPGRATALGDLENPARDTARALADPFPDPSQAAREHADPVRQERGVRRVMNVRFHDGG